MPKEKSMLMMKSHFSFTLLPCLMHLFLVGLLGFHAPLLKADTHVQRVYIFSFYVSLAFLSLLSLTLCNPPLPFIASIPLYLIHSHYPECDGQAQSVMSSVLQGCLSFSDYVIHSNNGWEKSDDITQTAEKLEFKPSNPGHFNV